MIYFKAYKRVQKPSRGKIRANQNSPKMAEAYRKKRSPKSS